MVGGFGLCFDFHCPEIKGLLIGKSDDDQQLYPAASNPLGGSGGRGGIGCHIILLNQGLSIRLN